MTKNEAMFVLDHNVEIRIPTQCGDCKKTLPEQIHAPLLDDAKRDFGKWFGEFEVTHKHGGYTFPDGTLAEEEVDVVSSNCSADALEEHMEDLAVFAVRVANELSQDSVALSIDGRMRFYDRTADAGKCLHAKKGKAIAMPLSVPEGRKAKTDLEKLQALHNALDSFSSLDAAKYVFGELLSYDLTDESLPWRDWSKDLKEWLIDAPQVFAYAKGFKIVYLHQSSEQLSKGTTRAVIARIMRDHANAFYGLFVVSNKDASAWELVNARLVDGKANRLNLRRVKVGTKLGARTATERLQLVDLASQDKLTAQEIQALHDSAFDVEGISKEFYQKIAAWYFWAQGYKGVKYPRSVITDADKSIFFIRMLTRLIFCWFMRAKGLVPEELFDLKAIKTKLKDSKKDEGIYYKAILQNLFFATLNREIKERSFRHKNDKGLDGNYGVTTLYRYADLMKDPDEILAVFKKIPFVNGGLFECLDDTQVRPEIRRDDFSENGKNPLCIPDDLFFGLEREIDLSGTYGDKKHKKISVAGLINILKKYQFTVEENTPLDQSVALDPELLGKVFENLLASFNEETKTTARKALGAFYTPREIVDYMVDEALLAYLKGKLPDASEDKLRALLAYSDEPHGFSDDEVEKLIDAIDHLKALDPAVGSGAFPMGMLHKLVHVLGKLDPRNEKWKQRQLAKIDDIELREQAERAFRDNPADYGRKLYLIQNCIYGVDIQPVAVQIAKMRFFISLLVDQKQTGDPENNYGILALPNLETNFVAANTLIGIDRPQQLSLRNPDIEKKEEELHRVRQAHFSAKTPKTKAKCREKDEKLRAEIAELLKYEGWGDKTAQMLANWNPYDQNASAEFFDLEWMFGIKDGVDIVIGNPPYGVSIKGDYRASVVKHLGRVPDYEIYYYFIESAYKFLKINGIKSYIIPNTFLFNLFAAEYRKKLLRTWRIHCLLDLTAFKIFEMATVFNVITILEKDTEEHKKIGYKPTSNAFSFESLAARQTYYLTKDELLINNKNWGLVFKLNKKTLMAITKIKNLSEPLEKQFSEYSQGLIAYDKYQGQDQSIIESRAYHYNQKKKGLKPWLWGEDVSRYKVRWNGKEWIDYCDGIANPRLPKYFKGPRILIREITNPRIYCAYTEDESYHDPAVIVILDKDKRIKYLLAVLNSNLATFYHFNSSPKATKGAFPKILVEDIKTFPLKRFCKDYEKTIMVIVDWILYLISIQKDSIMLESLIDSLVYELYFQDEIKAVDAEILKHLKNMPDMRSEWSDKKKLDVIEAIHKEFFNPKHPVSIAIAKQKTVAEVRIIEGLDS